MSARLPCAVIVLLSVTVAAGADADARRRKARRSPRRPAPAAQVAEMPAPAAEPLGLVAATMAAKLRTQPGESFPLVATVPPGTRLEVLGRDGRWLRVRHGKTQGWVTRTSVAGRAAQVEEAPSTPRWRDRFTSAKEMDQVEYPATPRPARPVAIRPAVAPQPSVASTTHVRAGLGMASRALNMTATDAAAAYRLRGLAFAGAIGFDAMFGRRAVLVADGGYGFGRGSGADVRDADGATMATVPFSTHEVDLGAAGGARMGDVIVAGRIGYHYEAALVDDLGNAARLPSEHLQGPTVGGRVELAMRRLWLRAGADLMVAGERAQSIGLEDGTPGKVSALFAQAAAGFALRGLRFDAAYRLGHHRTEWSGPSPRQPVGGGASRSDHLQTFTVGVSRRF